MSQRRREQAHVPVQPEALVQSEAPIEPKEPVKPEAEEAATEPIGFSTKSNQGEDMVMRRTMTVSRFVPGARLAAQQQPP